MPPTEPPLDRRTFVAAMVLAQLAPQWQARGPFESNIETRTRLALTALDIAETFLRLADAYSEPLGVPAIHDPPF